MGKGDKRFLWVAHSILLNAAKSVLLELLNLQGTGKRREVLYEWLPLYLVLLVNICSCKWFLRLFIKTHEVDELKVLIFILLGILW